MFRHCTQSKRSTDGDESLEKDQPTKAHGFILDDVHPAVLIIRPFGDHDHIDCTSVVSAIMRNGR